jgi:hypothetical protein
MIKVNVNHIERISQGDILRDVDYLEGVSETEGNIEVIKIRFPLVIVLTQDCDLQQDDMFRKKASEGVLGNQDKYLLSVLVAPLYNLEHVYTGEHLAELGMKMTVIDRKNTQGRNLKQNQIPRYHYLEFPQDVPIVPSVIDFKHYFSVDVLSLQKNHHTAFVCGVSELYREDISQRFSSFLSRIGLPNA